MDSKEINFTLLLCLYYFLWIIEVCLNFYELFKRKGKWKERNVEVGRIWPMARVQQARWPSVPNRPNCHGGPAHWLIQPGQPAKRTRRARGWSPQPKRLRRCGCCQWRGRWCPARLAARGPMVHGEGTGQPQRYGGSPKGQDIGEGRRRRRAVALDWVVAVMVKSCSQRGRRGVRQG
jgi:hypothetical protein